MKILVIAALTLSFLSACVTTKDVNPYTELNNKYPNTATFFDTRCYAIADRMGMSKEYHDLFETEEYRAQSKKQWLKNWSLARQWIYDYNGIARLSIDGQKNELRQFFNAACL